MNAVANDLQGLNVLVTRPKDLATTLAQMIEQEGGHAILYPVINIDETSTPANRDKILSRLSSFDIAIFISPTAAAKTFEHIKTLPPDLLVAAIGSGTEKALNEHDVVVTITSEGHTSEDLLCHHQLQANLVEGKSIVIFRGVGGRDQLGNTLKARGAKVSYAEMYRRTKPRQLASLSNDEINELNIITVTSNEGLQNLFNLTNNSALLKQKALIVPGARCKQLAQSLGFREIIQSANATDSACMAALKGWANQHKPLPEKLADLD